MHAFHQALMSLSSAATRRSTSVARSAARFHAHDRVSPYDLAVLEEQFQFIRNDAADAAQGETDWAIRMSVRYYRQLFREYALADLSRYKEGKIGLRWRTEREVVAGKGHFSCGNKRCDARTGLQSYELLFAYTEQGNRKRCLVKVRVCSACAEKVFYKKLAHVRRQRALKMAKRDEKRRLEGPSASRGTRTKKRQRRAGSKCSDASRGDESVDGHAEEARHGDPKAREDEVEASRRIHDVCTKINAEERAAYSREQDVCSHQHRDAFDDLLP
ncbi:hypothetical protein PsorP6_007029 [Peronosclerospora sorghi]|uniref:Uncharacterized protein n=1 Tax=Peronosclerospora sorghi TaxID=230839 RepID=A0ACC0W8H5_9STRA|nr:hypothetical protein PsorP6_007029 [Peronosclerospora sorghi]